MGRRLALPTENTTWTSLRSMTLRRQGSFLPKPDTATVWTSLFTRRRLWMSRYRHGLEAADGQYRRERRHTDRPARSLLRRRGRRGLDAGGFRHHRVGGACDCRHLLPAGLLVDWAIQRVPLVRQGVWQNHATDNWGGGSSEEDSVV